MLDVYVRDWIAGQTWRVSVTPTGAPADGPSWTPRLSADGRYVAFTSQAGNLAPADTNGVEDVFLHDRLTRTTTRIVKQHVVPPHTRVTLDVGEADPDLAATDVAARIVSDQPIVAERAMYLSRDGEPFSAGHAAAGVTAPAPRWYLAEGATGPFFDLFLLAMNPGPTDTHLRVTYVLPDGSALGRDYLLPAESRLTIYVDAEADRLRNTAVSTIVESVEGTPVVVERSMWWPDGYWYEGHATAGTTAPARRWAVARTQVRTGVDAEETYLLIFNPSETTATVTLTFDRFVPQTRLTVLPHSRATVPLSTLVPTLAQLGLTLSVLAESDGPEIVVEAAVYTSAGGVTWAAGSVVMGVKLP